MSEPIDAKSLPSLLIPVHLAQGILNYLQDQPYKEVSGLVTDLLAFGNAGVHSCVVVPEAPPVGVTGPPADAKVVDIREPRPKK